MLSGLEYPPGYLGATEGDVVVDLGANIGSFALYFDSLHRSVSYRGIAVEPFAESFALLTRNLEANHIDQFTAYQIAVSGTDGTAHLRTDLPVDEIRLSENGTGVTVESLRLSTFCARHGVERIDLLKMDIEGAEHDVVEADFDFLCSHVVTTILECHEVGGGRTGAALFDRLNPAFKLEILHRTATSAVIYAENRQLERLSLAEVKTQR